MSRILLFVATFLVAVSSSCLSSEVTLGAWVNEPLEWARIEGDNDSSSRIAQAEILYFGEDHRFGLIYCYVIGSVGNNSIRISNGDPREVSKGDWSWQDDEWRVSFRLSEATISVPSTESPTAVKNGVVRIVGSQLALFEGKKFRRAPELDETVRAAAYFKPPIAKTPKQ